MTYNDVASVVALLILAGVLVWYDVPWAAAFFGFLAGYLTRPRKHK